MYGIDRFCDDIESMIGFRPNLFWRTCWRYVSPLFLIAVVISAVISSGKLTYHNYLFPNWATAFGWMLSLSSVSAIPIMFVAYVVREQYFNIRTSHEPDSQPSATFV